MVPRLYVNVDHVATLRQQRDARYPDPVLAAGLCEQAGADGITVHLREDRRHIQERDVRVLRQTVRGVFNLEMAATDEMLAIALEVRPDFCTLVPEKRAERTTEGGLNLGTRGAASGADGVPGALVRVVRGLRGAGIAVSLFIDPDPDVVARSHELGASTVELHTGYYCDAPARSPDAARQLARLDGAARAARDRGLRLGAGHGLDQATVGPVAALPHLEELNIGHGLVARAVMVGMERAVADLRAAIAAGARSVGAT
jgi:pyridoxine 5-phosphate synthase